MKALHTALKIINALIARTPLAGVISIEAEMPDRLPHTSPGIRVRYRLHNQEISVVFDRYHLDIYIGQCEYPSIALDDFYLSNESDGHPVLGRHISWIVGGADGGDPTAFIGFLPDQADPVIRFETGVQGLLVENGPLRDSYHGYEEVLNRVELLSQRAKGKGLDDAEMKELDGIYTSYYSLGNISLPMLADRARLEAKATEEQLDQLLKKHGTSYSREFPG